MAAGFWEVLDMCICAGGIGLRRVVSTAASLSGARRCFQGCLFGLETDDNFGCSALLLVVHNRSSKVMF